MALDRLPGKADARLSRTFSALSDPTRRAIVHRLSQGDASAGELAQPFSIGLPTVSKHLRALEDAGLVVRERHAQWHVFRLRGEPLAQAEAWLRTYEGFWAGTLDSLQDYVRQLAPASGRARAARSGRVVAKRKPRP